jgi:hypothetical protein
MSKYLDRLLVACREAKESKPERQFEFNKALSLPRNRKYIYVIEDLSGDPEATFQAFIKYKATGNRKCPKANEASKVMYVGSSLGGIKRRIKEHKGYGSKSTYALNLDSWFKQPCRITVYEYDVRPQVLQLIEDSLAHDLEPAFGKRGPNGR